MNELNVGKSMRVRAKPTMVTVGRHTKIDTGRWNDNLMANYVEENGRRKWIKLNTLERTAYGAAMPKTEVQVRRHLSGLFRELLSRGLLLLLDRSGPRRRTVAVKIFDKGAPEDEHEALASQIEEMRKRGTCTMSQYEQAKNLALATAGGS